MSFSKCRSQCSSIWSPFTQIYYMGFRMLYLQLINIRAVFILQDTHLVKQILQFGLRVPDLSLSLLVNSATYFQPKLPKFENPYYWVILLISDTSDCGCSQSLNRDNGKMKPFGTGEHYFEQNVSNFTQTLTIILTRRISEHRILIKFRGEGELKICIRVSRYLKDKEKHVAIIL